jgi:hypothetical protein
MIASGVLSGIKSPRGQKPHEETVWQGQVTPGAGILLSKIPEQWTVEQWARLTLRSIAPLSNAQISDLNNSMLSGPCFSAISKWLIP